MSRFKAWVLAGCIAAQFPQAAGAAPFDGSPETLQRARQMCKQEISQQKFNNIEERQIAFKRCVQSNAGQRRAK